MRLPTLLLLCAAILGCDENSDKLDAREECHEWIACALECLADWKPGDTPPCPGHCAPPKYEYGHIIRDFTDGDFSGAAQCLDDALYENEIEP